MTTRPRIEADDIIAIFYEQNGKTNWDCVVYYERNGMVIYADSAYFHASAVEMPSSFTSRKHVEEMVRSNPTWLTKKVPK